MEELVGRERQLQRIDNVLEGIHASGAALLIEGAPGIGKSALLRAAADRAETRGFSVLTARGVQSEADLPFAALHQLLQPLRARWDELPARQRAALRDALEDTAAGETYILGLAVLELLSRVAEARPLVVLIDDAQWIDPGSATVLSFVARRITADPIVAFAALRTGYSTRLMSAGLEVMTPDPLPDVAGRALLDRLHVALRDTVASEVLRVAGGNPLALIELPPTIVAHPAGAIPPLTPLSQRLERSFAARVEDLPPPTRSVLLAAAADDRDDAEEILLAAELLDPATSASDLGPAVDAGMITLQESTVQFRHPLVRSAIYQAAGVARQLQAHRALGEVVQDAERRAWHRCAGAVTPDEDIAEAMARVAESAYRRGVQDTAVTAWERSAGITPSDSVRSERYVQAAETAAELGQHDRARLLLERADPAQLDLPGRARAVLVGDRLEPDPGTNAGRIQSLVALAGELIDDGAVSLAVRLLLSAASHAWAANPGTAAVEELVRMTSRLPFDDDDPVMLTIRGFASPGDFGILIRERAARIDADALDEASTGLVMSVYLVGADPVLLALVTRVVDNTRAAGRFAALPFVLAVQAWYAIALARWPLAVTAADEARRVAHETGQALWEAAAIDAQTMIAALRGEFEESQRLAARAEAMSLPLRLTPVLCGLQLCRGVAALAAARYETAYVELRRLFDPSDVCFHPVQSTWGIGDFAEAAAHTGRVEEARVLIAGLLPPNGRAVSPWGEMALQYARPLLAADDPVDALFDEALNSTLVAWPTYHARLLLEYGSRLRRNRRVADARVPLRRAHEAFENLGLPSWADRAGAELRAAGEDSASVSHQSWGALSPQELQIAQMAAEGYSNREIAERLYLSTRTVDSHLYRVFPKLGITSRNRLRAALNERFGG